MDEGKFCLCALVIKAELGRFRQFIFVLSWHRLLTHLISFDYLHFVNCKSDPELLGSVEQGCSTLHAWNWAVSSSNEHHGSTLESSVDFSSTANTVTFKEPAWWYSSVLAFIPAEWLRWLHGGRLWLPWEKSHFKWSCFASQTTTTSPPARPTIDPFAAQNIYILIKKSLISKMEMLWHWQCKVVQPS